ncbi:MAG: bifunctional phosphoribosylaminoimidazolecarboxamide formyltransferase/IMP cyclohydrolase [Cryobacterium sp.]|nr:bifunctional phosphoribosylaminoimidazolecarboxamide formyltransferase/IMP cyclohydrolase [Oligoflexia bacterium]
MTFLKPRRALLSVSDKTGLIPLAKALSENGCVLYASGGTRKALLEEGLPCLAVEDISGSPEAFQGRMKTLSFSLFGGILARRGSEADDADREKLRIPLIDVVVVNFYPFTSAGLSATSDELTELIDIGGPALVRAGAKNQKDVLVLADLSLYAETLEELKTQAGISADLREKAAARAWESVRFYDEAIARKFGAERESPLRYGENPHQSATFRLANESPIDWKNPCTEAAVSYNNILDFSAGFRLLSDLANWKPEAAHAVIIKHQNPCGVATDADGRIANALDLAWACDPTSAFGGLVLLSRPLDADSANFLQTRFIEGIAAPGLFPGSAELTVVASKRKNLKAVTITQVDYQEKQTTVSVPGGTLAQAADAFSLEKFELKTEGVWRDADTELAQFGVLVAKALKSNAIAIVENPTERCFRLLGAGQGQPNRIEAIEKLAIPRARAVLITEARSGVASSEAFVNARLSAALLVSDAFFPFADAVEVAAAAGIKRIVEPGGSMRDNEVIARATELGVELAFTGVRHFRH